ncbi:DoxX-like family protein [Georgenia satyanarayanai]|uniref:DoxX-like family protein n=1 Tax=Georgenia satyanarayanai TaxID=860221 RepID=A0A2Y8ZWP5_9MICO|nr:DoxX family protein [Georgenia satyanarayanai]PYG01575.1 DoxX-like protein [Georgenia satyanarayanai]SSA36375.1 DoxX-like family protein [Georgenia satyanarayanai]
MSAFPLVLTVLVAVWVGFSAVSLLRGASWVVDALTEYGVPRGWWPWLGLAKLAGAVGLLVGLAVPVIGVIAGVGLVLYFTGAVVTVVRARSYSHIPYPLLYLVPVVGTLSVGSVV